MRSRVTDPPTQESPPVSSRRAYEPAAEERFASNADAHRHYAVREAEVAHDERRRALATLDTADVIWRLLRIAVWTISAIIALSIVFHVLSANPHNSFVSTINDWADTLAGPFAGMFILHSAKATIALDYAIAIVVYVVVAEIIINLIGAAIVPARRRAATGGSSGYPPSGPPNYPPGPPPSYPQYQ